MFFPLLFSFFLADSLQLLLSMSLSFCQLHFLSDMLIAIIYFSLNSWFYGFGLESMFALMTWYFFTSPGVCSSQGLLRILWILFSSYLCIQNFHYVLFIPVLYSKIVLFLVDDLSLCIFHRSIDRIFFRHFGMLLILFDPVPEPFEFSFFRQYLLTYFF